MLGDKEVIKCQTGVGTLHVHSAAGVEVEAFSRLARGLLAQVAGGRGARLLVCELTGDVIALGRFQRARTAVRGKPARVRRVGGGVAVAAGTGTIGVALALPSLGGITPDKVLNRWVRGLDAGLTRAGAPGVHYFGRDHVVASGRRLGCVSQEIAPSGEVLLEAIVGVNRPLSLDAGVRGYPTHGDVRISGLRDVTLAELAARELTFSGIAQALAEGWAGASQLALHHEETPPRAAELAVWPEIDEDEAERGLEWSGVADVPIGFVEALARAEGGKLAAARLRGDFLAPSSLVAEMERQVIGVDVDYGAIATRLQGVLAASPIGFLIGLRDVGVLAEALVMAARA
jgi:hypothetical protein